MPDSSTSEKDKTEDRTSKSACNSKKDCNVLTAIAQCLDIKEPTDDSVNEQLAKLINELIFKPKKPDETKTEIILRPENCKSLVVTKVDVMFQVRQ